MKPILMNTFSINAILEGRKIKKKIYRKPNESTNQHLANRLMNGIKNIDNNNCWIWGNYINNKGYGKLTINKKSIYAHRLSYQLKNGKIPLQMLILHKCDNPRCINPEHLFLGTQKDNMQDCSKKGRTNTPIISMPHETNPMAKLTSKKVKQIRLLLKKGLGQYKIAKKFNISQSQVSNIKRGIKWKNL